MLACHMVKRYIYFTKDQRPKINSIFYFLCFSFSSHELREEHARKKQVFPRQLVSDSRGFPAQSTQNSPVTGITFAWKNCDFFTRDKGKFKSISSSRHFASMTFPPPTPQSFRPYWKFNPRISMRGGGFNEEIYVH